MMILGIILLTIYVYSMLLITIITWAAKSFDWYFIIVLIFAPIWLLYFLYLIIEDKIQYRAYLKEDKK